MDARRVTAVVSLALVGAVVVGLIATSGSESGAQVAAPAAQEPEADSVSTDETVPTPPPAVESAERESATEGVPVTEAPVETAPPTTLDPDTPELPNRGPHPEFREVQEWIQTNATEFDDFDGKVLAVQFWTFGCHNCQATYPHMRDLHQKYAGEDFEVVGVHAPEFDFEDDVDAVRQAAEDNGLVWPIAVEFKETKANFRSWQDRRFWPRLFLIDADGNVRYDHIGEGAYDEIDAAVGALIAEKNA